jgi:hypothetical protein
MRISLVMALLVVGCGSSTPSGGSACKGSLEQVAGDTCPATYALALSTLPECSRGAGPTISVGSTGESDVDITLFVLSRNWGICTSQCFYDLQTQVLVGALFCNDVPNFCDHTSHSLSYGRTTSNCSAPRVVVTERSCSSVDAGP